jgi:hypothetical protein
VARQAFRGLVSLDELNMHDNKLVRIKSGTFKPLVQLKQLRLFINGIKSIGAGVFEGMVVLEELYIGKNKVRDFQKDCLLFEENFFDNYSVLVF